jgi:hypothetical protein
MAKALRWGKSPWRMENRTCARKGRKAEKKGKEER